MGSTVSGGCGVEGARLGGGFHHAPSTPSASPGAAERTGSAADHEGTRFGMVRFHVQRNGRDGRHPGFPRGYNSEAPRAVRLAARARRWRCHVQKAALCSNIVVALACIAILALFASCGPPLHFCVGHDDDIEPSR